MPIQLPNLDDRTYADLVEEAQGLIPTYAPEWTNHNPSDPGITLIELFAYLTEMLLYRLNRVTDATMLAFIKLLNGPDWIPPNPLTKEAMSEEIRQAVLALREPNRAVTSEDFERLARQADQEMVARARCFPRRNLESGNALAGSTDEPGHISVVIIPIQTNNESNPQPTPELLQKVADDLEPRRLLTTRVHVVGPTYLTVRVRLTLVLKPDAVEDQFRFGMAVTLQADLDSREVSDELRQEFSQAGISLSPQTTLSVKDSGNSWLLTDEATLRAYTVRKELDQSSNQEQLNVYEDVGRVQAIRALKQYLHPLHGGRDGHGWPFGRNVYTSEIYELLDTLPGVDYITKTVDANSQKTLDEFIVNDATRLKYNTDGGLVAVELQSHELIDAQIVPNDITLIAPKNT
jgi:hypothetical protein